MENNQYLRLFNDIVKVVIHDYAAYEQKKQLADSNCIAERIAAGVMHSSLLNGEYVHYVDEYLASFGDPNVVLHVNPELEHFDGRGLGVLVRRFENSLVVEAAQRDSSFKKGDKVTLLSSCTPAMVLKTDGQFIPGDCAERERWEKYLSSCRNVQVTHSDGSEERIRPTKVDGQAFASGNQMTVGDDGVARLCLSDLDDAVSVRALAGELAALSGHVSGLVVDVRNCAGFEEEALLPLLPYLVDRPASLIEFLERTAHFRNSPRNRRFLSFLLESQECAETEASWVADLLDKLVSEPEGPALAFEVAYSPDCAYEVEPRGSFPVVVLSDVRTVGMAELLAKIAVDSARCTLMGRNSAGTLGTLFPASVKVGNDLVLEYPMACYSEEAMSQYGHGTGIPVEVHVPWTPEMLERDVDMERSVGYCLSMS